MAKQNSGWFSSIFGGSKEQDIPISGPSGFRHESHVGWDPQNGFEIRNIPPDWKKVCWRPKDRVSVLC
jgi:Wiskott-Aldrich syndrome protein